MYELVHFMHTTTLHLEIIFPHNVYKNKKAFAQHLVPSATEGISVRQDVNGWGMRGLRGGCKRYICFHNPTRPSPG